jgi:hypothetical protein
LRNVGARPFETYQDRNDNPRAPAAAEAKGDFLIDVLGP